jgi:hypothetical protein
MAYLLDRPDGGATDEHRADDEWSAPEKVDWAGLPIDLDMAFSCNQRDKVYVQHQMRIRGAQTWRWTASDTQASLGEAQTDNGQPHHLH